MRIIIPHACVELEAEVKQRNLMLLSKGYYWVLESAELDTAYDILVKLNLGTVEELQETIKGHIEKIPSVKIEINEKGTITGRYLGNQIATIDNTTNQDGTSSWSGKFMQMINKGDMMVATGSGTGDSPNSKGIVKIRGEGDMWTGSTRLANLNGAKWTCEGESNIRKGSSVIRIEIKE